MVIGKKIFDQTTIFFFDEELLNEETIYNCYPDVNKFLINSNLFSK